MNTVVMGCEHISQKLVDLLHEYLCSRFRLNAITHFKIERKDVSAFPHFRIVMGVESVSGSLVDITTPYIISTHNGDNWTKLVSYVENAIMLRVLDHKYKTTARMNRWGKPTKTHSCRYNRNKTILMCCGEDDL
jgi:preprotein translocase subunit Sec63